MKRRQVLRVLALAVCSLPGAGLAKSNEEEFRRNWTALHAAIAGGQPALIQSFVGKTITLSTGREKREPTLVLLAHDPGETPIRLLVIAPAPRSREGRQLLKVQKYSAAMLEVLITGVIRSIKNREITVEPIELRVGAAT